MRRLQSVSSRFGRDGARPSRVWQRFCNYLTGKATLKDHATNLVAHNVGVATLSMPEMDSGRAYGLIVLAAS